jgi:hypothetical protein
VQKIAAQPFSLFPELVDAHMTAEGTFQLVTRPVMMGPLGAGVHLVLRGAL